ncbi:large subunit of alpha-aminoadipate reductase [Oleoguttula sp. CCFEE 6159]|nr:large subunit of alpha-aminoadipate reductase [Oleoguttula sp. CCFEE 6159]
MAADHPQSLPDPTADLHWSDYKGAIHEIFAANAQKHPDRPCVIETSPRRQFTYRQINEASNILAHHLVQHGVQRGEVVMLYSYRNVDLFVAYMGVLKAGGTVSVIDPQYPPARQQIYLEVAQPRALVIIEKASQEAGDISSEVRAYINDNLQLRTEVPALALHDDGTLLGGELGGKDCLAEQVAHRGKLPGVVVGPDSTPTLSFTSGSEGRAKGVKGRHFSLAYYFDFMSKQFNLTENDRFTMLSGIAHDPIQRDIFTPAYLGATLLVPSREDIQHEKLAEWMGEHSATVTHLTPAMGQILVGGATAQFPSLHHAFFVGDILIKRDCRRLQELAPNCNIVNMYGTTETQRAVSYYEIPSKNQNPTFLDGMGEVIPAGKGMQDVQLLVVDRENRDRICNVGEVGEIYVRAGGLAEGYLGLDDTTKAKFVKSWFVDNQRWIDEDKRRVEARGQREPWREFFKGPRDRLYKSGDLGRYTKDINVEVVGRIDDQIKIRGFRIELGEIDTHLSQHPLVRENVTLVRRDKDEEQILVSYIVPEIKRWTQWLKDSGMTEESLNDDSMIGMLKRFRPLRDNAREHLKKKLPAYAVPTIFVPLIRMPLNPNGKIDKPALPFPEPAELRAAAPRRPSHSVNSLSDTEKALRETWASLLKAVDADALGPNDDFFDVGGNSLIAQRLLPAIKSRWQGVALPFNAIFTHKTLRRYAAQIDRALDPIGLRLDSDHQTNGDDQQDEDYAASATELSRQLPNQIESCKLTSAPTTVFLTGATGFLGAYVLRELLSRQNPPVKVIAHVRASSADTAMYRLVSTCKAYGIWSSDWTQRLETVTGDLEKPQLGLSSAVWDRLAKEVDVVIHNGARVHWVLPYSNLRAANVLGTLAAIALCATGKPKQLAFVSSTSVLDTEHYVNLSDAGTPVPESDDLEGSRKGLGTGYGQSKWAAEYLVREAGKRGLRGTIVRPGYVTGESKSGTSNTDDFLVRMLKGCVQLGSRPDISNTVNQVPVDHVASVVVASAFHPPTTPLGVAQVTSHPRLTMNEYLGALQLYGYDVPLQPYEQWKEEARKYVEEPSAKGGEEFALLPLYHMITTSLPASTRAPELADSNAAAALRADHASPTSSTSASTAVDHSAGAAVTPEIVGVYLAYLVALGFMPAPPQANDVKGADGTGDGGERRTLPEVEIGKEQKEALRSVGGRGGSS